MYDAECNACGLTYEVIIPHSQALPPCPQCQHPRPSRRFPKQNVTRTAGPKGVIFDERQIYDTHGKNWRNPHNHQRPGGDRKRMYWY